MVQRQDDERPVPRWDVDARKRLLDVGRVVAVGQNYAFRVGSRSRCIGYRGVGVVCETLTDFQKLRLVVGEIFASLSFECSVGRFARFERNGTENDD